MGYQHGKQAEPIIRRYLAWISKLTGKPAAELEANAMRFLPFIENLSPVYIDEIFGLAEGARLSISQAVLCQVRAEASRSWDWRLHRVCADWRGNRRGCYLGGPESGPRERVRGRGYHPPSASR